MQFNVGPPEVLRSPYLSSPCLAGVRRPAILLPDCDRHLTERNVLVHELAHLARGDCYWNLLTRLATAVFFFQPLLWRLSSRLAATAEEVCDDYVVAFGGDRHDYAHRLVDLAELSTAPIAGAGIGIVALRSTLARRVARILDPSRSLSTRVSHILLAGVLAGGLLATLLAGLVGVGPQGLAAESGVAIESEQRPALTATLSGRVLFDGNPPERVARGMFRDGPPLVNESLVVGKHGGIANVLVWMRGRPEDVHFKEPADEAVLRIRGQGIEPRVLAMCNRVPLKLINENSFGVNLGLATRSNPPANLLLRPREQREIVYARAEQMPVLVAGNIQSWLQAWLLPLDHPFFAVTSEDGRFEIDDLPPGEREFALWHERFGWLKTDRFPTGRFQLAISPGENPLGDLLVEPAGAEEQVEAASTNRGPGCRAAAIRPRLFRAGLQADSPDAD